MPWQGVTVEEQRANFIRDWRLGYYSVSELADRFGISRKTAHKWINRFCEYGNNGYKELPRRPHRSPGQTPQYVVTDNRWRFPLYSRQFGVPCLLAEMRSFDSCMTRFRDLPMAMGASGLFAERPALARARS